MTSPGDWIEWKGGECPVDPGTIVDLRFSGMDNVRGVGPRHHEMWGQRADSARWPHVTGSAHRTNIIAYRVVSK